MWYTHKNPYGCWICDLIFICEQNKSALPVSEDDNGSTEERGPTGINTKSTEL